MHKERWVWRLLLFLVLGAIALAWTTADPAKPAEVEPLQLTIIKGDSPQPVKPCNQANCVLTEPDETDEDEPVSIIATDISQEVLMLVRQKTRVKVQRAELEAIIVGSGEHGVHWQTLVAVYTIESSCGRDPNMEKYDPYGPGVVIDSQQLAALERICAKVGRDPKSVRCARHGELGPFQFRPATFEAYGVDVDGDGVASPWSLRDATATAANYLAALDYLDYTPWSAAARYNAGKYYGQLTGQQYASKVLHLAKAMGAPLQL